MADKKISALTGATTPLAGTEVLPIVQSGATVKVAVSDLTAGRAVSATQLTSTVAIGTAPLVVTSTTNVANLNASSLNGATFAAPGAIGGGTAAAGAFTSVTINNTGNGSTTLATGSTGSAVNQNMVLSHSPGGGAYSYTSFQISGVDVFGAGRLLSSYTGNAIVNAPDSTGSVLLNVNATTKATLSSTNLTFTGINLVQGTAAKGINFTANTPAAGMTSQLLNWYEEGTWTPVDGSGAGLAFTVTDAVYTREGNMVFASASVTYPITANAAGAAIGGLPFTIGAVGAYGAFLRYTNYGDFMTWLANPSGTVLFAYSKVGASITNVGASAKRFDIVAIYKV